MSNKDFYEFAKKLDRSSRIFESVGSISSNMEHIFKILTPYLNNYEKLLPTINIFQISITPTIIKLAAEQQRIAKIFTPQMEIWAKQEKIFNSMLPQMALLSEALKPYLEWNEKFKGYDFESISRKWTQLSEVLAKQKVNSILLADYWIIMDNNLFDELKEHCLNGKFDVNKYIIQYYSKNKFANIELVLNQIKNSNCLKNTQIEIFNDCYSVMKKMSYKIACNTLIPTLTAQTDGLLSIICDIIPKKIQKAIMQEKSVQKNSTAIIILAYLETLTVHGATEKFKTVIKEKAFSRPKKNDTYQKSRHTILHGKCGYGSKENLIRCWLEIAFLIKVYCLILAKQQEEKF